MQIWFLIVRHHQLRGGGGSGIVYFDPSLTRYIGWFIALPSAKVEGTLTYNGQTHNVHGEGYHDHNWGTVNLNQVLDRWFWTTGHFGNYTLDAALYVTALYYNHQQLPAFYLAKGNQVLINEMNHLTLHGSGNLTAPGGHDYPKTMKFHCRMAPIQLIWYSPILKSFKLEVLLFVPMPPYSEILNICV